ncbi:F-box domain [Dillenia turbinata]|uniref:F-box domain n=1 Tax=Dillenia turbinata TaxID=194707 RepID=A0AAN8W6L3_9MAGN
MGCVSSKPFREDLKQQTLIVTSSNSINHVVSLTSSTYGALNLDKEERKQQKSPLKRSPEREEPEIINTWELMEDLEEDRIPISNQTKKSPKSILLLRGFGDFDAISPSKLLSRIGSPRKLKGVSGKENNDRFGNRRNSVLSPKDVLKVRNSVDDSPNPSSNLSFRQCQKTPIDPIKERTKRELGFSSRRKSFSPLFDPELVSFFQKELSEEEEQIKKIVSLVETKNGIDFMEEGEKTRKQEQKTWSGLPTELLELIISRLGLEDNIRVSAVCKSWQSAAIAVRFVNQSPWLMYFPKSGKVFEFFDPARRKSYSVELPELIASCVCYSKDGWLLLCRPRKSLVFFFNPFNRELIKLPKFEVSNQIVAFSSAPTSAGCIIFTIKHIGATVVAISTCCPGATEWTTAHYPNRMPFVSSIWNKLVFCNGLFFCLSLTGWLGVFDPKERTWEVLVVPPPKCPANFFGKNWWKGKFMAEYEGELLVIYTCSSENPIVFKLDQTNLVWEEMGTLNGATLFASFLSSHSRTDLPGIMRNSVYFSKCLYSSSSCLTISFLQVHYPDELAPEHDDGCFDSVGVVFRASWHSMAFMHCSLAKIIGGSNLDNNIAGSIVFSTERSWCNLLCPVFDTDGTISCVISFRQSCRRVSIVPKINFHSSTLSDFIYLQLIFSDGTFLFFEIFRNQPRSCVEPISGRLHRVLESTVFIFVSVLFIVQNCWSGSANILLIP